VLELAQAFAADEPPARTLLFLLASGEEKGLIGTRYYLDHPSVPLDQTVANLNFEMIGRPDELIGPGKLWLTGFERTTLGAAFREAGFDVVADERPEQNFFQRSDNYAFAVLGIVGQTLSSYNLHEDYHNVTDEADTLDYEHMQAATRSAYAAARLLSQGEISPEWLPGGKPEAR
jgi:Zn-dependent M28 family amino/carboxypeptidase